MIVKRVAAPPARGHGSVMQVGWLLVLAVGCAHPASATQDEITGCSTDADCALTRVEAGACCPMLCTPRVVTRKRAEVLEANLAACNHGKPCPQPLCRPPVETITPACVQNRCLPRTGPSN